MAQTDLIPAATILLVRDAPTFEVLMVERHHQIDFASGALVFPGGKAAPDDSDPVWARHSLAPDGISDLQRCLRISAVREAFEESGVLLARRQGQSDLASAQDCAPVLAQRDAIAAGATSFRAAVANAGLSLALDLVVDFAHWITPKGMPKRFDTWFYIAVTPGEQIAAHDGGEAVDAVWIEPAAALSAAVSGARKIIFPTRLNIELLARSASAQGAMADARARAVRTVEPWIEPGPDGPILVIDPDAGYGAVRELLEPNRP